MKTSDVILVLFFLSLIDIPLNLVTVAAAAKSFQSWPDSTWAHRRQPTRLPCPWDSPGKNTGVGCHFLLQCMNVKSESEVAQLCSTPGDPMDCSLPGSSIHGIFQARVLEWGAIAFSIYLSSIYLVFTDLYWQLFLLQGIFPTQGSNPGLPQAGRHFNLWATREAFLIV